MRIKYFATLRDLSGVDEEDLTVNDETSIEHIFEELKTRHPDIRNQKNVLFALNEKFADSRSVVRNNDVLALFPPVSGG
ncbi:ThiamineS [mine drainage metagenome]|uniref:ThiamineS n=1 Tax=mine drainage metagenome TaxID=410659 RepID=T1AR31_9ZZZZ